MTSEGGRGWCQEHGVWRQADLGLNSGFAAGSCVALSECLNLSGLQPPLQEGTAHPPCQVALLMGDVGAAAGSLAHGCLLLVTALLFVGSCFCQDFSASRVGSCPLSLGFFPSWQCSGVAVVTLSHR